MAKFLEPAVLLGPGEVPVVARPGSGGSAVVAFLQEEVLGVWDALAGQAEALDDLTVRCHAPSDGEGGDGRRVFTASCDGLVTKECESAWLALAELGRMMRARAEAGAEAE